jgi:hypothetical protein
MKSKRLIQMLLPDLPEYSEEYEFLLRELDLTGTKINHEEENPLPVNSLLYCNNLSHWEKRLSLSEKSSVSVIIATNEYYKKDKWLAVNKFESIKCAFIQYLPNSQRTRFGSTIKFIFLNVHFLRDKAFWQTIKSAFQTHIEMRSLRFEIPVFSFPLGYTDRFVTELKNLLLLPENSNSLFADGFYENSSRKSDVSFVGQKGRWYRRLMVDYFEEKAGARTNKYGSFGGFTDLPETTNYAKSILASRFVVCPPGNVSSQSFRYYEAIALGAIPIVTEVSIQDWNTHNYWPKHVAWKSANFIDIWLSLKKMNSEALDELIVSLRASVLEQLQTSKNLLRASVEGQNMWIREDSND